MNVIIYRRQVYSSN